MLLTTTLTISLLETETRMVPSMVFRIPGTDTLVDNRIHRYTEFQLKMMLRISQFDGFVRFLTHSHTSLRVKAERPILLTWEAYGHIHALRVGRNRVLEAIHLA